MKSFRNIFFESIVLFLFLIFYSCHSDKIKLNHQFNGVYQIESAYCNYVINIYGSIDSCYNGQLVNLFNNNYSDNQKWKLIPADADETYYIISSGCNKALEYYNIPGISNFEEQALHIYNFNKNNNQKWHIVPVNKKDGFYYIYSHFNNMLIDIYSPENKCCIDNQKIQLYRFKGEQNQKWLIKKINV